MEPTPKQGEKTRKQRLVVNAPAKVVASPNRPGTIMIPDRPHPISFGGASSAAAGAATYAELEHGACDGSSNLDSAKIPPLRHLLQNLQGWL